MSVRLVHSVKNKPSKPDRRRIPVVRQREVECHHCGLDPMCNLLEYGEGRAQLPEGILTRRRSVSRGELLFQSGESYQAIYAVKSGSFKTFIPPSAGNSQIIGFHLPGELMGIEGIADGIHRCSARALEPGSVCELSLQRLPETGKSLEKLQKGIIEILGKEVAFDQSLIATLIRQSAEQRLAAFLLSFSARLEKRGMPGLVFDLPMSRSDIASYLGLASETVSRLLTRFQKQGLVAVRHKKVKLEDPGRLAFLASI